MTVQPVPDGYQAVIPYLLVEGATELIPFLEQAFGAREMGRIPRPDGRMAHAELRIEDSVVMLGEPMGEFPSTPGMIFLYVADCDAVYARALEAGGTSVMEVTHMHHAGERYGGVQDPCGNVWWIGTHVEDLSWEEQARRAAGLAEQNPDA